MPVTFSIGLFCTRVCIVPAMSRRYSSICCVYCILVYTRLAFDGVDCETVGTDGESENGTAWYSVLNCLSRACLRRSADSSTKISRNHDRWPATGVLCGTVQDNSRTCWSTSTKLGRPVSHSLKLFRLGLQILWLARRLEPQNTAYLILLKVDSISVCFSVAGIMDYLSVLAYSLISSFIEKTVVEFKYFLVFFYLCFVTKCSYPKPCPFSPFVVCFIYCLSVSRLYILYICALRVGQIPLKTT